MRMPLVDDLRRVMTGTSFYTCHFLFLLIFFLLPEHALAQVSVNFGDNNFFDRIVEGVEVRSGIWIGNLASALLSTFTLVALIGFAWNVYENAIFSDADSFGVLGRLVVRQVLIIGFGYALLSPASPFFIPNMVTTIIDTAKALAGIAGANNVLFPSTPIEWARSISVNVLREKFGTGSGIVDSLLIALLVVTAVVIMWFAAIIMAGSIFFVLVEMWLTIAVNSIKAVFLPLGATKDFAFQFMSNLITLLLMLLALYLYADFVGLVWNIAEVYMRTSIIDPEAAIWDLIAVPFVLLLLSGVAARLPSMVQAAASGNISGGGNGSVLAGGLAAGAGAALAAGVASLGAGVQALTDGINKMANEMGGEKSGGGAQDFVDKMGGGNDGGGSPGPSGGGSNPSGGGGGASSVPSVLQSSKAAMQTGNDKSGGFADQVKGGAHAGMAVSSAAQGDMGVAAMHAQQAKHHFDTAGQQMGGNSQDLPGGGVAMTPGNESDQPLDDVGNDSSKQPDVPTDSRPGDPDNSQNNGNGQESSASTTNDGEGQSANAAPDASNSTPATSPAGSAAQMNDQHAQTPAPSDSRPGDPDSSNASTVNSESAPVSSSTPDNAVSGGVSQMNDRHAQTPAPSDSRPGDPDNSERRLHDGDGSVDGRFQRDVAPSDSRPGDPDNSQKNLKPLQELARMRRRGRDTS